MLLDVLTGFEEIQVCTAYKCGDEILENFPASLEQLAKCEPVYETMPGWTEDITKVEKYEDLPENCRKYIEFVEEKIGYPITLISNGPERHDIIRRGFED